MLCLCVCAVFTTAQAGDHAAAPAAAIYNKGAALYARHKWDAAKECFHEYLAEYSDSPLYITCLYYLANCYQQLNNTREAVSIYHKVMDEAVGGDRFWAEMAEKRVAELSAQAPGS